MSQVAVTGPAGLLRVVDAGRGTPTVVLVHGLAGTSAWWDATVTHLAAEHHVIAYDLRGHGESAPPADGTYDLAAQVRDLAAVVDARAPGPLVLVGHSFGATVVLAALTALGPSRVSGAVLVDAAGDFSGAPPGAIEQFIGALHSDEYADLVADAFTENLGRAQDATRRRVLAGVEQTSPAAMRGCYTALLRWQPGRALAAWGGPVLLIGDAGNESSFALHAQHPERPRTLVADASHWLHLDQPAAFHAALDSFLASLNASDATAEPS